MTGSTSISTSLQCSQRRLLPSPSCSRSHSPSTVARVHGPHVAAAAAAAAAADDASPSPTAAGVPSPPIRRRRARRRPRLPTSACATPERAASRARIRPTYRRTGLLGSLSPAAVPPPRASAASAAVALAVAPAAPPRPHAARGSTAAPTTPALIRRHAAAAATAKIRRCTRCCRRRPSATCVEAGVVVGTRLDAAADEERRGFVAPPRREAVAARGEVARLPHHPQARPQHRCRTGACGCPRPPGHHSERARALRRADVEAKLDELAALDPDRRRLVEALVGGLLEAIRASSPSPITSSDATSTASSPQPSPRSARRRAPRRAAHSGGERAVVPRQEDHQNQLPVAPIRTTYWLSRRRG